LHKTLKNNHSMQNNNILKIYLNKTNKGYLFVKVLGI